MVSQTHEPSDALPSDLFGCDSSAACSNLVPPANRRGAGSVVNYVLFNQATTPAANLLIFLPRTFGKPPGPTALLHAAADAGYRVISLDYNDEPAVNVYCPLTVSSPPHLTAVT